MSELDKFKRRMIRSVARLLLHEKKPEEEVWEELKKETGCDCELLWQRMRALTMKKLKRLLAADDRVESIAAVARLSATDWLLFDMVLVHEQFDVIGRDKISSTSEEHKPLMELFSLVQRYSIEGAQGDQLAERWSAATVSYNNDGRNVSPMLLQRRWYQMKALARHLFYKLWFSYRGNHKLWENAQRYQPSRLQMAIAKRYPHVITQTFPTWEEQIEKRLVILPEVFDEKMRMVNLPKPCDDNDPDLVVLEPVIETIDLRVDSDNDDVSSLPDDADFQPAAPKSGPSSVASPFTPDEDSNTMTSMDIDLSTVKQEPQEEIDGLSNVKIIQATHVPQETIESDTDITNEETLPKVKLEIAVENPKEAYKRNLLLNVNQFIESTQEMFQENELKDSEANQQKLVAVPEPTTIGLTKTEQEILEENESIETQVTENIHAAHRNLETDDIINEKAEKHFKGRIVATEIQNLDSDDIIREKADQFFKDRIVAAMSVTTNINPTVPIETATSNFYVQEVDDDSVFDDIIKQKADEYISKSVPAEESTNSCMQEDTNDSVVEDIKQKAEEFIPKSDFKSVAVDASLKLSHDVVIDGGIAFVDDGIEYLEEDADSNDGFSDEETEETTHKFDLKLLMKPIVYTMKLDNMTVLQGNNFESVHDKDVIESIVTESRPVSKLAINILQIKQENEINKQINLSDDKRISDDLFTPHDPDDSIDQQLNLSDNKGINDDLFTSNDPNESNNPQLNLSDDNINNDDLFTLDDPNDSSDNESDPGISEDMKVKPTSYLLQKPRSRSYNPIQLCKNPDFNTRLKRLTVGFFISQRNRRLIKECKPMTIDVHKAFEPKLVNGTLYLKSSGGALQPIIIEDNDQSEHTAVVPSAMPVQSIIDNTIADVPSLIRDANLQARSDETGERNKIINLPDITQIRRINQRLQTAEVTPIRVQNTTDARRPLLVPAVDLPERDKNLLGGVNSDTPVNVQETNTNALLKSNRTINVEALEDLYVNQSNENSNSLLNVRSVSSVSSQDNVSSYAQQSSEIKNVNQNIHFPGNQTITKHSLPVDNSIVNPPLKQTPKLSKLGRPLSKLPIEKPKPKASPYYCPTSYVKQSKIAVPWNKTRKPTTYSNLDEFLITIDTLNKMINKINGHDLYINPQGKNKKQYWVIDSPEDQNKLKLNDNKAVSGKTTVTEQIAPKQKAAAQQSQDESAKMLPKKRRARARECCWSKYRIEKLCLNKKHYKPHPCPLPTCNCCCRESLAMYRKSAISNLVSQRLRHQDDPDKCQTSIVLSDDDDDALRNACASIETVVQRASTPTPIVRVIPGDNSINKAAPGDDNRDKALPIYIIPPNDRGSIYPGTVTDMTPPPTAPNDSATNTGRGRGSIRVVDAATMQQNTNVSSSFVVFSHSSSSSSGITGRGLPLNSIAAEQQVQNEGAIVATLTPEGTVPLAEIITSGNVARAPSTTMYVPARGTRVNTPKISTETQTTDLPLPQNVSDSPPIIICKQAKHKITLMAMDTYQRKLVIDGSKRCPITRKVVQEKTSLKNNVFNLNMSNKSAKSPICLGKNQILLTTVKFPRMQVSEAESVPEAAVIPTSPLPAGVHLLLMPNGELTYSVDPGVQLSSELLSALPAIVAAIQKQINVAPPQPVNNVATVTSDEIIKLSDDENTLPCDENGAKESTPSTYEDKIPVPVKGNQETYILSSTQDVIVDQSKLTESAPDVQSFKGADNEPGSAIDPSITTKNQSDTNSLVTTETIVDNQVDDNVETQLPSSVTSTEEIKNDSELANKTDTTAGSSTPNEFEESNRCNKNVETFYKEAVDSEMETSSKNDSEFANKMDTTAESTPNEFEESSKCNKNVETSNKEADDSAATGTSRNLLSDLMEMSGISAEDTKLMPQECTLPQVVAVSSSPAADTLLSPKALQNNTIINTTLVGASTDSQIMNLPELTAVTSLAELKYACENNGKFFRLDLDTGVIGALNVCIKKNPKKLKKLETTTTVVDLTDDAESTKSDIQMPPLHVRHLLPKLVELRDKRPIPVAASCTSNEMQEAEVVKPVKLFKAVHKLMKTLNKVPILNRKAFGPKYTFVNSESLGKHKIRVKQKRKQLLDKIEAKIDLVDSDAPMEEEYLVESSDSEDEYTVTYDKQNSSNDSNNMENITLVNDAVGSSDDSSDDEPLAKKAKRIRCNDSNKTAEDEKVGGDSNKQNAGKETELIKNTPSEVIVTTEPVESSTNITDAEIESTMPSTEMGPDNFDMNRDDDSHADFLENQDSDSQDDCILGV